MDKPVFYHQSTCGMCRTVELMLKKYSIDYESCTDTSVMKNRGIMTTPVIEVAGERLIGKDILAWINENKQGK